MTSGNRSADNTGDTDLGSSIPDPIQPPSSQDQQSGFRAVYTPGQGVSTPSPFASKHARGGGAHRAVNPVVASASGEYSRSSGNYGTPAKRKKGKGKKIALIACLVVVLVLAGAGAAVGLYVDSINKTLAVDNPEEQAAIDEQLVAAVSDEPFYIMLVGSDTRNDGEGARSDTNIVARIDLSTATVTLISIPRDTAIDLDGYGTQKFNAAYTYGGVPSVIHESSQLLGVGISHYAEVDFDGVVELVDAMGGVDVDVPMAIIDADAGGSVEQGMQHLDGEHALVFARSRSYVTGDFQRTTSQRLLIEAIVNKVLSLPPTELPGIVQKMANCVKTDLKLGEIIAYAQQFQQAGDMTIYSAMVPSTTADKDGISYVLCDTKSLTKMMQVVNSGGDPGTVVTDNTVTSSEQAIAEGQEATPVYVETDSLTNAYYDGSSAAAPAYDYSSATSSYDYNAASTYNYNAAPAYDYNAAPTYDYNAAPTYDYGTAAPAYDDSAASAYDNGSADYSGTASGYDGSSY